MPAPPARQASSSWLPPPASSIWAPARLIASVEVTNDDGARIKAGLPANATITLGVGTDNSVRWLMGEDATAVGLTGALRDMWNPRCFGNPGKVSDTFEYTCSTADGGGVHTNSGVPNHGYALLVDGGTYNGQTVGGIGLTKAAHIYFRAMSVYQGPATDFADHADALEQSCSDLIGSEPRRPLDRRALGPGHHRLRLRPGGQGRGRGRAAERRPTQCGFQPCWPRIRRPLCETGGPGHESSGTTSRRQLVGGAGASSTPP